MEDLAFVVEWARRVGRADPRRERGLLCVVEEPTNLLALERTGSYRGLYHVLGGSLSPLQDIGPDRLHIEVGRDGAHLDSSQPRTRSSRFDRTAPSGRCATTSLAKA